MYSFSAIKIITCWNQDSVSARHGFLTGRKLSMTVNVTRNGATFMKPS